ncbi:TPA: ATP-grasp fold amidoligase family protein [Photobacterium damselae]
MKDDESELISRFRKVHNKLPDLKLPKTFSDKIIFRILNERDERFTTLADKYLVREYVANKIGDKYLIPLIGVYKNTLEIDIDQLPDKFVLKCNHDSGSVVICKDKSKFNFNNAVNKLDNALKINYYHCTREQHYKDINPLILCEKFITEDGHEPNDYKFHMFNQGGGRFKILIQCDEGRFSTHTRSFYTDQWDLLPFELTYPKGDAIQQPSNLLKMIELAKLLASNFSYVRVDFYEIKNQIFFGEMTFTPGSGMESFSPRHWDETLGSYWIN